jgi:IS30 family transposase
MHNLSSVLHTLKVKFDIKERRKHVASLLSRYATEREIAREIGVDRSTISRDIKALKIECQQFVYDLAKSDLAYYYKQSIDGIEETAKESWKIYNGESVSIREKLLILKIIGYYQRALLC